MDLLEKYLEEGGSFGKQDKPKENKKLKKDINRIVDKLSQAGMFVAKLSFDDLPRSNRQVILDGIGDAVDELNKFN